MDHKKPMGDIHGKKGFLDKKVPKSTKYGHIKSTVKTGKTVNDVEIISDAIISKRKSEVFKRIKKSTLAKMLEQIPVGESIYHMGGGDANQQNKEENIYGAGDTESVYSMQSQVSHFSAVTYATDQLGITSDTKFLLLDLREPEQYQQYHITQAINFPAPNIGRDKIISQLFRFKNKEDKLIIVYTNDERSGVKPARQLVQKGYENLYLLSGGLQGFEEEFPELIEGKCPPSPKAEVTGGTKKKAGGGLGSTRPLQLISSKK